MYKKVKNKTHLKFALRASYLIIHVHLTETMLHTLAAHDGDMHVMTAYILMNINEIHRTSKINKSLWKEVLDS